MANLKTMFFEHIANYLSHEDMDKMMASGDGDYLKALAANISACLHEDWKQNLIREKGKEYQHFRPVKDADLEKDILENPDKYLSQKSEDGKNLYKIVEKKNEDGSVTRSAQFDLIRVEYQNLSKKWQLANYDAAQFALCMVKTAIDKGAFQGDKKQTFQEIEMMSHDVHIEWMHREKDWADVRLLVPYEQLIVSTEGHNEKDKDRAHVLAVTNELTFKPNILDRNRTIVERVIEVLFKDKGAGGALTPEIMKKVEEATELISAQNKADYERCSAFKETVKKQTVVALKGKTELGFRELESICEIYYNEWKKQAKTIGKLPAEYDASYSNLLADDTRINFKNAARLDMVDLVKEMVGEGLVPETMLAGANAVFDESTELGLRVKKQNEEDLANYQAMVKGNVKPE